MQRSKSVTILVAIDKIAKKKIKIILKLLMIILPLLMND
jgi:hypothetical protein